VKFNSVKFKITFLYVVLLGVILLAYRGVIYIQFSRALYKESDDLLRKKAQAVRDALEGYFQAFGQDDKALETAVRIVISEGKLESEPFIGDFEEQWFARKKALALDDDFVVLVSAGGEVLASSDALSAPVSSFFLREARNARGAGKFGYLEDQKNHLNLKAISLPVFLGPVGFTVVVGTSFTPIIEVLRTRLFNIAISIPVFLLIAWVISDAFASRILRPVVKMTNTARNISRTNLHARVNVEHFDEEMRYLADAFNDMISRLEESFRYIDNFSSFVAHELKTPLAVIQGESELALMRERPAEEYRQVLIGNLAQAQTMLRIIDDLLLLAKLEYQLDTLEMKPFDLTELLTEVHEESVMRFAAKPLTLSIDLPKEPLRVRGNKSLLRRLFLNLMDNAAKFTSPGGRITMSALRRKGEIRVSVSDTGCGIAETEISQIFKEFYRGANGKEGDPSGHGLGLAISEAIAKLHHGEISVQSRLNQGSVFTVRLPS
jgi:two-component system, OmpR family, heavy metal sensor histidine kinase CusS